MAPITISLLAFILALIGEQLWVGRRKLGPFDPKTALGPSLRILATILNRGGNNFPRSGRQQFPTVVAATIIWRTACRNGRSAEGAGASSLKSTWRGVMARGKPPRHSLIAIRLAAVRSLCPMIQNAASERCEDRVRISEQ
jgi:hypothetical protein